MISIVNYGLGNLGSIVNMLQYLNIPAEIIGKPDQLKNAERILLPGVGAFDSGMDNLNELNWGPILEEKALQQKVPFLGICLGMQLMTQGSEEGHLQGLGWIKGRTRKLSVPGNSHYRVPHMGWANVSEHVGSVFHSGLLPGSRFYFAHSYTVELEDPQLLWLSASHGSEFCAGFRQENIIGVQFHPEKSHKYGLDFFKKFYFDFPK